MEELPISILGPIWLALGASIVTCAVFAHRSTTALRWGCYGVSVLWVAAGAAVNASLLLTGHSYSGFADAADVAFVRRAWESVVVPNQHVFIGLLVAFETIAGVLVLFPGRPRKCGLISLIAFNIALLSFTWRYVFWSAPMVFALVLLMRAGRRTAPPRHAMKHGSLVTGRA